MNNNVIELCWAAFQGDLAKVRELIEAGVDALLIKHDADVNAKTILGPTVTTTMVTRRRAGKRCFTARRLMRRLAR
jgi:ankyrin repeat protein